METRKVQLSGGTTYTISLPKSWAEEHGIDAGSVISLTPNDDGSLVVETADPEGTTPDRTTVDIAASEPDELIERVLALYLVGYDEVTLKHRGGYSDAQRQAVTEAIDGLSGFETIEKTAHTLRLQDLIDAATVDIRKTTLRLRLIALSMHEDAIRAITDHDEALADRVVARDAEVDKLFARVTRYFRRSLSDLKEVKNLGYSRDDLFEYYYTGRQLERIADHAEKIASFVRDRDQPLSDDLLEQIDHLGSSSRSIVDDAARVVLEDASVDVAYETLRQRNTLRDAITAADRQLYDHVDPEAAHVAGLVFDSIRRTSEYGANIAEIGIQRHCRD